MSNIKTNQILKYKIPALIFVSIFSFGLIWSFLVPGNNEAPDEASHLNMISFLQTEKRIPVFNQEPKIVQTQYSPSLLSGAYYSMAYNSPFSYLPYLIFKADLLTMPNIWSFRVISSLFIALFAVFLFLALKNLLPNDSNLCLIITLFIAFIPQLIFSAGYINIEPIALFLSALSFYCLTIMISANYQKGLLGFGVSSGLLALCKANYYLLIAYFILVIIFDFKNKKLSWEILKKFGLPLVIFLLINVWWWARNYGLYGDPLVLNYIKQEILAKAPLWFQSPRDQGYNILTIFGNSYFFRFTFLGFFANLGGANIFLPTVFYLIFYGIIISSIGLSIKKFVLNRSYLLAFLIIIPVTLLYFANKNLDDFSPQGRHLFPVIIPLAVVLLGGIKSLNKKTQKLIGPSIVVFSLFSSIWGIFMIIDRYYVKGLAYVNESNKMHFLADFSWRHLSIQSLKKLVELSGLSNVNLFTLSVVFIIFLVSFCVICRQILVSFTRSSKSAII